MVRIVRSRTLILFFCTTGFLEGCAKKDPGEQVNADSTRQDLAMNNASIKAADVTELVAEKNARNAAQLKLDSNLVLALKKIQKEPPFDKLTALQPSLKIRPDGRVLVDLDASVSKQLLEDIKNAGGEVINSFDLAHSVRALVPLSKMEALAGRKDVKFIQPAAEAATNR